MAAASALETVLPPGDRLYGGRRGQRANESGAAHRLTPRWAAAGLRHAFGAMMATLDPPRKSRRRSDHGNGAIRCHPCGDPDGGVAGHRHVKALGWHRVGGLARLEAGRSVCLMGLVPTRGRGLNRSKGGVQGHGNGTPPADCLVEAAWHHDPPNPPLVPARTRFCGDAGSRFPAAEGPRTSRQTGALNDRWAVSTPARTRWSKTPRSPAESRLVWSWRSSRTNPPQLSDGDPPRRRRQRRLGVTRDPV